MDMEQVLTEVIKPVVVSKNVEKTIEESVSMSEPVTEMVVSAPEPVSVPQWRKTNTMGGKTLGSDKDYIDKREE